MITAFVLSGGGNLGAIQVGMLRALAENGITADLLIGTSAGALNAGFVAAYGSGASALADLQRQWVGTRRRDVFPLDPARQVRAMTGRSPSLFSNAGLRRIIEARLDGMDIDATATPLRVVATDLLSGQEFVLDSGPAVTAILASTAIPSMYPPVQVAGRYLVDGGLADNTAISVAVEAGADRIIVLPAGYPCALDAPPRSALGIALQALEIMIQQRLIVEMQRYAERVAIATLPPPCPLAVSPLDFGQAAALIDRTYGDSVRWIDDGGLERERPEQYLALHSHQR